MCEKTKLKKTIFQLGTMRVLKGTGNPFFVRLKQSLQRSHYNKINIDQDIISYINRKPRSKASIQAEKLSDRMVLFYATPN